MIDPKYIPPRGKNVSRFRKPIALTCDHLGPRVFVAGSARDWHDCAKGIDQGAGPGVVCECQGCGPSCPKYTAAASVNPEDEP